MPLSSDLAVNRLKLSNTAGKTTINTGVYLTVSFKLKPKTKTTFREIFGNCPWADPNSFNDYVQAYNSRNLAQLASIQTPETGTIGASSIIYESQGDIFNPFTGDPVPSGTIAFLDLANFTYDIGDAEIPSTIYTVQSNTANTDVALENGNRAIGVL